MKKLVFAAFFAACAMAAPASATTYQVSESFSTLDNSVSGTGVFGADLVSGQVYHLTSVISGSVNGSAITALSPYAGADQDIDFGSTHYLDFFGDSFATADGNIDNLFFVSAYSLLQHSTDPNATGSGTPVNFSATLIVNGGTGNPNATPLPGALPLLGSVLGAAGLLSWRRKFKKVV